MTRLTISAEAHIGPVSLRVVTARGQVVRQTLPPLSSHNPSVDLELPEGDYVVLGTQATGQILAEEVSARGMRAHVSIRKSGRAPHEFMRDAADRGLVPEFPTTVVDRGGTAASFQIRAGVAVSGTQGRSLRAIVAMNAPPASTSSPGSLVFDAFNRDALVPTAESLWLRCWEWAYGRWRETTSALPHVPVEPGAGYFRATVASPTSNDSGPVRAVALVDARGFGPLVIVPPFRTGLDLAFLSDGLTAREAASRLENPSVVRVPVALALPHDPWLGDLLAALASSGMSGADELLTAGGEAAHVDTAFQALWDKRRDLGAAFLGAHYVLRFMPGRLPVRWLENLVRLAPNVADGPTLLAARYIAAGGEDGRRVPREEIRTQLREALARPVHLFARSRGLLVQSMRLYGPALRARRLETAYPRRPRPSDFLDVAADAGGLEAFWGTRPGSLGPTSRLGRATRAAAIEVRLDEGVFTSYRTGQPPPTLG